MKGVATRLLLFAAFQLASACDWPLLTDQFSRTLPDAEVRVTATPKAGGAPETLRGVLLAKASSFGPCPPPISQAVARPLRMVRLAAGAGRAAEACDTLTPERDAILVASRGTCNFLNKTLHASEAGAIGLVVGNIHEGRQNASADEAEELPLMGCPDGFDAVCANVTIPTVIVNSSDQQRLQGKARGVFLPSCV
jgi:hypothetical protein